MEHPKTFVSNLKKGTRSELPQASVGELQYSLKLIESAIASVQVLDLMQFDIQQSLSDPQLSIQLGNGLEMQAQIVDITKNLDTLELEITGPDNRYDRYKAEMAQKLKEQAQLREYQARERLNEMMEQIGDCYLEFEAALSGGDYSLATTKYFDYVGIFM